MTPTFEHEINKNPKPEDIGVIKIYVNIIPSDDHDNNHDANTIQFFTSSLIEELLSNQDCKSRTDLDLFFTEDAGISYSHSTYLMMDLISYVYEVRHSNYYSPNYLLSVWLDVDDDEDDYHEDDDEDDDYHEDDDEDDDMEDDDMEDEDDDDHDEYAEYYERHGIRFRPTNKFVIENLNKMIYKKTSESIKEICTICLEEMKNGETVAILPCGHGFDEKCVMKWLDISHVCPICRFELPCE